MKVLHVYAIYQKTELYLIIPLIFQKPFPLDSVCEIRGEVYMQYSRNAKFLYLTSFLQFFKNFPSRKVLHVWNTSEMQTHSIYLPPLTFFGN